MSTLSQVTVRALQYSVPVVLKGQIYM